MYDSTTSCFPVVAAVVPLTTTTGPGTAGSTQCKECGSQVPAGERWSGSACAPCAEMEERRGLRRICGLCRGRGYLNERVECPGISTLVERRCHECGGTGEQVWPR